MLLQTSSRTSPWLAATSHTPTSLASWLAVSFLLLNTVNCKLEHLVRAGVGGGILADKLSLVGKRGYVTVAASLFAAPFIWASVMADNATESFAALGIGFALSESWRAPAAVMARCAILLHAHGRACLRGACKDACAPVHGQGSWEARSLACDHEVPIPPAYSVLLTASCSQRPDLVKACMWSPEQASLCRPKQAS